MQTDNLPSSGGFNPERAARLRAEAQDAFKAKMRKLERRVQVWLALTLILVAVFAAMFSMSNDTRSWILFGVGMLVMFENTVLIKLWYWIVNNKVGVLHEIKLLRMDLALQKGSLAEAQRLVEAQPPAHAYVLPKWERAVWRVVIGVSAAAVVMALETRNFNRLFAGSSMSSRRATTLEADGSAGMETVYLLQNTGRRPIREFALYSHGAVPGTRFVAPQESPYTDDFGRPLPVRMEPADTNHKNVVALSEPVDSGERFTLRERGEHKAILEGDVWTYTMSQNWGYKSNQYSDILLLPPDAEVVSSEPAPKSQVMRDGRLELRFEAVLGSGEPWQYTVKYRLGVAAAQ